MLTAMLHTMASFNLSDTLGDGTASFNLSNTLGDGMVLQRAPQSAVVWGFGTPGANISVSLNGEALSAVVDGSSTWRMTLPPTPASTTSTTLTFSDGTAQLLLKNVLFGDVFLCSGQSNMQYTPRSMAGMNNMSAELAAADSYASTMRFFTVGMDTSCGDPAKGQTDCSYPFNNLNTNVKPQQNHTCGGGRSCRESWEPASAAALGGSAWNTFSAVCWLMGRDIHDALGGKVPIGLISSNWGGTPVQVWQPLSSVRDCGSPTATVGGSLYNSMIAPFTVGPMALTGASWYQGESNVGGAAYYACAFPSMITRWREAFHRPQLWFGFVQVAGWGYSHPFGPGLPETDHSHAAGDLRQAQLAALRLPPPIGMTTAIDTGDWVSIHPPDKQAPSRRLANQILVQIYGQTIAAVDFPMYAGSAAARDGTTVTVTVAVRAGVSGAPIALTTDAPAAATQSSTLGQPGSVPRTQCVTFGHPRTFPQDCGYPAILGAYANGTQASLNASAAIGPDGSSLVLTATAPAGFQPTASSYGRASWPRTVFFSKNGGLPVIPWFANFSTTDPWTPPLGVSEASLGEADAMQLRRRVVHATATSVAAAMVEAEEADAAGSTRAPRR